MVFLPRQHIRPVYRVGRGTGRLRGGPHGGIGGGGQAPALRGRPRCGVELVQGRDRVEVGDRDIAPLRKIGGLRKFPLSERLLRSFVD